VTAVVLDSGALIAIERGDRATLADLSRERARDRYLVTTSMVLAQVWRGGSRRQATLASYLDTLEILPVDEELGKRTGVLLGQAGTSDAVDASLVLVADDGDHILTSDPTDIGRLVEASGRRVLVVGC
jgi:predicted nucleic acid-binding protein